MYGPTKDDLRTLAVLLIAAAFIIAGIGIGIGAWLF